MITLSIDKKKSSYILIFLTTFLVGFWAHGYRYFNSLYSHDSLDISQGDFAWQISLGRFMQVPYIHFRGQLTSPMVIGVLSLLFLGCALCIVQDLLSVAHMPLVMVVCALFVTQPALTFSNASFINWSDIYMLALLLNVMGIWATHRYKYGFLVGWIGIMLGTALYQAYMCSAIALALLLLMRDILGGTKSSTVIKSAVRDMAVVLCGLVTYAVSNKIVQTVTGISSSDGYNGIASVGDYSGISIPKLLLDTFLYPFHFFSRPDTAHRSWVFAAHILLALVVIALLIYSIGKKQLTVPNQGLLTLVLLFFPLGINAVYFISKGMAHDLMRFSYVFSYLIVVVLFESVQKTLEGGDLRTKRILQGTIATSFALISFCNIIFSNGAYLKKDMEYTATLSTMTRILDRVEQVEGYIPQETPVVFVGTLDETPISKDRQAFGDYYPYAGMLYHYSATYNSTLNEYLISILGYPANLQSESDWVDRPEVQAMPAFPDKNSVQMIDGTVVVKLSDG